MRWLPHFSRNAVNREPWFYVRECGRYSVAQFYVPAPDATPMHCAIVWRWEAWRNRDREAREEPIRIGEADTWQDAARLCGEHAKSQARQAELFA